MQKYILIDSCYWFGLFDVKDQYKDYSNEVKDVINGHKLIIPFPSLYEVLNSKFIRNKIALNSIENLIKSGDIILLEDEIYRQNALENVYSIYRTQLPQISLVDSIIREILSDTDIKIDVLVTYNEKDFKDVCDKRRITILP